MLCDQDIHRAWADDHLGITPFDVLNLQPASYDLTLDRHFLLPNLGVTGVDLAEPIPQELMAPVTSEGGFVIEPGDFVLGCTREVVRVGPDLSARVEGKSSLGRLGLMVHITAGFIDPGFEGQITLEIVNAAPWEITLYPGQRIAQVAFTLMTQKPQIPYGKAGNHYQGQRGPVASRFRIDENLRP